MILINFSHPITQEQVNQIEELTKQTVERVISIPVNFENDQSFLPQMQELVDQIPYTSNELQVLPLLVNLPALNFIAGILIAELHGRIGYFPSILRISRSSGTQPPQFEVAEIINLQSVRDAARQKR